MSSTWSPVYNQDFPDPSVIAYGGRYYAYATQVTLVNTPTADGADTLTWQTKPDAMPTLAPWVARGSNWAPSVQRNASGQLVMYYSSRWAAGKKQCIGRATAYDPLGPFTDTSNEPYLCPHHAGDIDPDIYTAPSGQRYLFFKNDGNARGMNDCLWGVTLDANLDIASSPTAVMCSGQPWQQNIIERPNMVYINGAYYLFYAGGQYWNASYSIGFALCRSPLGPCYDQPANPVMTSARSMAGPGGPNLLWGINGQLEMAFAAWTGAIGYNHGGYRAMYMAVVGFNGQVPYLTPANQAPWNDAAPAISGTLELGHTLKASARSWGGVVDGFAYQWWRNCPSGNSMAQAFLPDNAYTLTPADVGCRLQVAVLAHNSVSSATAWSGATPTARAQG